MRKSESGGITKKAGQNQIGQPLFFSQINPYFIGLPFCTDSHNLLWLSKVRCSRHNDWLSKPPFSQVKWDNTTDSHDLSNLLSRRVIWPQLDAWGFAIANPVEHIQHRADIHFFTQFGFRFLIVGFTLAKVSGIKVRRAWRRSFIECLGIAILISTVFSYDKCLLFNIFFSVFPAHQKLILQK